jgi:hypothetical protein
MKISVAAVEVLREMERQDETQFCVSFKFQPPLNANVFVLANVFLNLTPCMTKLRVEVLCFHYFTDNYDFLIFNKKNKINNFFVILIFFNLK